MISNTIVNDIREEIATKIEASDVFQSAYAYPKSTIEGFPAAVVMPSENASDYSDTESNKLAFAFDVYIYYPAQKEADQEKAETAVGEAVGEILSIFSVRNTMTTCDWIEPAPSVWADITVGETPYRMATVTLRCVKYVDVN